MCDYPGVLLTASERYDFGTAFSLRRSLQALGSMRGEV